MSKPKTETPSIELVPIDKLIIDPGYNPRVERLFAANVKELAAQVEAAGGIDATNHHVTVAPKKDGMHVRDGHTLLAVAQLRGETHIPVMMKDMTADEELYGPIHRNSGHPLSAYELGTVFVRARDGQKPEDIAVGEEIREPKTTKQIAKDAGYSEQHVKNCIAIRESSEAIGALIESGFVSSSVVLLAKNLAMDKKDGVSELNEKKQLKIIQASIANARADGDDCASKKHFDAIKSQFAKPLKAATPDKQTPAKPADTQSGNSGAGQTGNEPEEAAGIPVGASKEPDDTQETESQPGQTNIGAAHPELDLVQPVQSPAPAKVTKAVAKKLDDAVRAAIATTSDNMDLGLDDADIDCMADNVLAAIAIVQSPI